MKFRLTEKLNSLSRFRSVKLTLRKKILLNITLTLFLLVCALSLALTIIISESFVRVEQNETRRDVQRVLDAVSDEESKLASIVQDWAVWDDAKAFLENPADETFIKANLNDSSLARLKLRFLVFLKNDGKVVFANGMDLKTGQATSFPQAFLPYLQPNTPFFQHTSLQARVGGLVLLDSEEEPLIVVSQPVLDSEGNGPSAGILMMARSLDNNIFQSIAVRTHSTLLVEPYNSPTLPADFREVRATLSAGNPNFFIQTKALSEEVIAGYSILTDINGNPALILRTTSNREIYQQGRHNVEYLVFALFLTGFVFGTVMLLMLERTVLARLSRLSNEVNSIALTHNSEKRVTMQGEDELTWLASSMNQMLEALDNNAKEQRNLAAQLEYQAYHDGLTGLPNRIYFEKCLNEAIEQARLKQKKVALLFLDLDRFKPINDTLGHHAGDWLLQEVAQRLRNCLRSSDIVARMGGDEFAAILVNLDDRDKALEVASRIVNALQKPFLFQEKELQIAASVGISFFPDNGESTIELLQKADSAMYRAKKRETGGCLPATATNSGVDSNQPTPKIELTGSQ